MDLNLAGKVAIVTGSGRGIGRATALTLGREGASVVIDDIDLEAAQRVEAEAAESGIRAMAFKADVTELPEVQQMVEKTLDRFGRIDILVNNVGILYIKGVPVIHKLFADYEPEDWPPYMGITLYGVLNCCKSVLGTMQRHRAGNIINIASDAARGPQREQITIYGAGKGAIIAFTRNLSYELGPAGIRVNCVSPGAIKTTRAAMMDTGEDTSVEAVNFWQEIETSIQQSPLRRWGDPQEVANVVAFLASDASSYVTGQTLSVNGGRFMA
jgi:NAD(P)-dependent dehydrogenase (short-subunit alcohol dehydrogenase family)